MISISFVVRFQNRLSSVQVSISAIISICGRERGQKMQAIVILENPRGPGCSKPD